MRKQVVDFGPDVLVTLDAGDGHRDHARVRDVTLEVARELRVGRVYLQCLPRSLMRSWVGTMKTQRPEMAHLDADVAQRDRAIAAHTSQQSPFEGLPAELRRAFLATDHARRVIPRWRGGARETSLLA